ncbi:Na+/H+ antiporter NhaC family protein [Stratiformator vulcanicus]|uniref:Malate-2H(+)/Na(+)-lactate antiporter n=1 Tax=Stratiformator vulcanicus TaxID=2527980 RepID=A0A517R4U8_9PLAN|nr:Na+/H+ antiporter NhaC family protein [Stratiformator vulcanicus]QDT38908.1 Malate-2H(+)/Na(+)-lactate antiporter [Stratiformator vulcanicus]
MKNSLSCLIGLCALILNAAVANAADGSEVAISDYGWLSLLPAIVAVILAIATRQVIVALVGAIFAGALPLADWQPFTAAVRTVDTYIVGALVPVDGSAADPFYMQVILMTFFLGGLVGVLVRSGGAAGLIQPLLKFATTRERGQVLTAATGFLIFFDDYANTILVGGTMRPLTDRLKISREKLAFLVDATAAPIAGLAIVSTWVGVEIGYIGEGCKEAGLNPDSAYAIFLATLPYRFYPLYLIAFVFLIGWTGRDFGPMREAEARARDIEEAPAATTDPSVEHNANEARPNIWNAAVPLAVLLISLTAGMIWAGTSSIAAENIDSSFEAKPVEYTVQNILDRSDSTRMLLLASAAASAIAVLMGVATRSTSLAELVAGWLTGVKSMVEAVTVLILAWAIATICDADHLGTATYLSGLATGIVSPAMLPAIAFVLAAVVALCIGSSWTTMALLIPSLMAIAADLNGGVPEPFSAVQLGTVGAVLAGAIFGDHCSPISDTTVLSSAASGCDHLRHVITQAPYAVTVAVISLVCGYVPSGFGVSPWLLLPIGFATIFLTIRVFGRKSV